MDSKVIRARPGFSDYVRLGALRWLHQLDLNPSSPTYGVADREFWAWKTKDFANGTWQGGLVGLLDARSQIGLENVPAQRVVAATLKGTRFIQRSNGSFEEAYPFESSYAVTALVVFNLILAYRKHQSCFTPQSIEQLREIVLAAIVFLRKTPETHGLISNHLVTGLLADHLAVLSLNLDAGPDPVESIQKLFISEEGWFPEYRGADPGYQTLLNHYLAAAMQTTPNLTALESTLRSSVAFISQFRFPDGSFAGEIGSRGTGIFYPFGGVVVSGTKIRATSVLKWFHEVHVPSNGVMSPVVVDQGNFVPVFNSWAALSHAMDTGAVTTEEIGSNEIGRTIYPEAGLVVARSAQSVAAISLRNGSVRLVNRLPDGTWRDQSLVSVSEAPSYQTTTQAYPPEVLEAGPSRWRLRLFLTKRHAPLNGPLRAIALRLLGLATYPFPLLQRSMKRVLAKFVMSGSLSKHSEQVEITCDLSGDVFSVGIETSSPRFTHRSYGFDRHMASSNTFEDRAI